MNGREAGEVSQTPYLRLQLSVGMKFQTKVYHPWPKYWRKPGSIVTFKMKVRDFQSPAKCGLDSPSVLSLDPRGTQGNPGASELTLFLLHAVGKYAFIKVKDKKCWCQKVTLLYRE